MRTKRKKTTAEFFVETEPETLTADSAPSLPESSYKPNSKIQIPIKEDGTIDIESLRAATLERLKQAVNSTPGLKDQAQTGVPGFPPQVVWAMYGGIGAIEGMIAQRMGKVPKEIADRVFTYTPQELELLTPPTCRVLQKYAAEWMIKYQDEIALATLLTSITISKVNAALMLTKHANVVEMPTKKAEDGPPGEVKPN